MSDFMYSVVLVELSLAFVVQGLEWQHTVEQCHTDRCHESLSFKRS